MQTSLHGIKLQSSDPGLVEKKAATKLNQKKNLLQPFFTFKHFQLFRESFLVGHICFFLSLELEYIHSVVLKCYLL